METQTVNQHLQVLEDVNNVVTDIYSKTGYIRVEEGNLVSVETLPKSSDSTRLEEELLYTLGRLQELNRTLR